MSNFLQVQNNKITKVVASSYQPINTKNITYLEASELDLDIYYELKSKINFHDHLDYEVLLNYVSSSNEIRYITSANYSSANYGGYAL
jgi:hypothetical protein